MSALSALRAKAAVKYPAYQLDLENGSLVTLKSVMSLDKAALKAFSESQKRLAEVDESEDLEELRQEFITVLAQVSNDPQAVKAGLDNEELGVITVIFEEYTESLNAGTKSESAK